MKRNIHKIETTRWSLLIKDVMLKYGFNTYRYRLYQNWQYKTCYAHYNAMPLKKWL